MLCAHASQGSFLFDLISRQELVAAQHFLIQGFPVPGLCSHEAAAVFPFPSIVSLVPDSKKTNDAKKIELCDSEVRALSGNSFHWAAIGAMQMFMLSCSSIASQDSQAVEVLSD